MLTSTTLDSASTLMKSFLQQLGGLFFFGSRQNENNLYSCNFPQVLKTTLRSAFQQTQKQNILRRQVDRRQLKTKKLPECLCLWPQCSLGKFHVRSVMTAFITCHFVFIDTKFHCDVICTVNLTFQFILFHNYNVRTQNNIRHRVGI